MRGCHRPVFPPRRATEDKPHITSRSENIVTRQIGSLTSPTWRAVTYFVRNRPELPRKPDSSGRRVMRDAVQDTFSANHGLRLAAWITGGSHCMVIHGRRIEPPLHRPTPEVDNHHICGAPHIRPQVPCYELELIESSQGATTLRDPQEVGQKLTIGAEELNDIRPVCDRHRRAGYTTGMRHLGHPPAFTIVVPPSDEGEGASCGEDEGGALAPTEHHNTTVTCQSEPFREDTASRCPGLRTVKLQRPQRLSIQPNLPQRTAVIQPTTLVENGEHWVVCVALKEAPSVLGKSAHHVGADSGGPPPLRIHAHCY
eukprot:Hpha_TRINITY_DN2047_c0_g1::TRINITY_DN2047_c0_g1_i1::g.82983::m.82983